MHRLSKVKRPQRLARAGVVHLELFGVVAEGYQTTCRRNHTRPRLPSADLLVAPCEIKLGQVEGIDLTIVFHVAGRRSRAG